MIICKNAVVMSIKPEFAYKIFSGTKKYEFRRNIFKKPKITKVIVYASSPVKKVIGEFQIDEVLELKLKDLWLKTKLYSGITEDFFMSYYVGKEKGFAIKITKTKTYSKPLNLEDNFNLKPPQSFQYL